MSFNRVHLEGGTGPHRFASFFTLFALFFAGASLVGAQEETYVCVQVVPGDSVEADHTSWIVAYGLAHGTAGGGHGRPGLPPRPTNDLSEAWPGGPAEVDRPIPGF